MSFSDAYHQKASCFLILGGHGYNCLGIFEQYIWCLFFVCVWENADSSKLKQEYLSFYEFLIKF